MFEVFAAICALVICYLTYEVYKEHMDDVIVVGAAHSPGVWPKSMRNEKGFVRGYDVRTGRRLWIFHTVPMAGEFGAETWLNDSREYTGNTGAWAQMSADEELGLVYVPTEAPTNDAYGGHRPGDNLFGNSVLALDLKTGRRVWHFQTSHHDIWDWDLVSGPILFDVVIDGRAVKGIASLGKTCYVYMLNRETGKPINPIVETAVPTTTDVPGEEVWPTQPIPYTSAGIPQQPFCATYPRVTDPALVPRVRQSFHPHQVNEFVIVAPGLMGGANYGSPSFSLRTGLLYATGKNDAWSINVKPVGDTLEPGPGNLGHFAGFSEQGEIGFVPTATLAAYDPTTGERVWYTEVPGTTNAGNLVTAGDLVFQGIGTGDFYAFDAETGEPVGQVVTNEVPYRIAPATNFRLFYFAS